MDNIDSKKIFEKIIEETKDKAHNKVGFFHSLISLIKPMDHSEENIINNIIVCSILKKYILMSSIDFTKEITSAELLHIFECISQHGCENGKCEHFNIENSTQI